MLFLRTVGVCLLASASVSACGADLTPLSGHGAPTACHPSLSVVGRHGQHGPIHVRPGQLLHLRGSSFTVACGAVAANTGPPKVEIGLMAPGHAGPVAAARPHGADGSFGVRVRIPASTQDGPATLSDSYVPTQANTIRLVVRR